MSNFFKTIIKTTDGEPFNLELVSFIKTKNKECNPGSSTTSYLCDVIVDCDEIQLCLRMRKWAQDIWHNVATLQNNLYCRLSTDIDCNDVQHIMVNRNKEWKEIDNLSVNMNAVMRGPSIETCDVCGETHGERTQC
jgi:hypothetical protein